MTPTWERRAAATMFVTIVVTTGLLAGFGITFVLETITEPGPPSCATSPVTVCANDRTDDA